MSLLSFFHSLFEKSLESLSRQGNWQALFLSSAQSFDRPRVSVGLFRFFHRFQYSTEAGNAPPLVTKISLLRGANQESV